MSLLLVGIGLAVALTFFAGSPARNADAADNPQPVSQKMPDRPETAVVSPEVDKSLERAEKKGPETERREAPKPPPVVEGPEDESLKVTIPAMNRIQNMTIPYADGGNEAAFKRYAGVHLRGTGHPWEKEANVYMVFRKFVVEPTRVSVTRPLEGRNIVTLQTCTLPDYSNRLIVQAEKVA